jgi:hypothetical protein
MFSLVVPLFPIHLLTRSDSKTELLSIRQGHHNWFAIETNPERIQQLTSRSNYVPSSAQL